MTDPAAQPMVWVSKWVDYSDKYGFGYQLCDDGVGVMFNDNSRIVLLANQRYKIVFLIVLVFFYFLKKFLYVLCNICV